MRSGKALHITQVTGGKSQTGVQFRVCWCLQGSWAGGRKRTGGNGLGGYAPGSGSRRKLGQRKRTGEAPGMLGNFLSMPHLALGTPSAVPPSRWLSWLHFWVTYWTTGWESEYLRLGSLSRGPGRRPCGWIPGWGNPLTPLGGPEDAYPVPSWFLILL